MQLGSNKSGIFLGYVLYGFKNRWCRVRIVLLIRIGGGGSD